MNHVISSGGNWTRKDLQNYEVKEREAVNIDFSGAKIITAPLPSSGGFGDGSGVQYFGGLVLLQSR